MNFTRIALCASFDYPGVCSSVVQDACKGNENDKPIKVSQVQLKDVPGLLELRGLAFANDPIQHYFISAPDKRPPRFPKLGRKITETIFALELIHKIDLTIDHDKAQCIASRAVKSLTKRQRMVDFLASKTELNIQKAVILTFWSKIQIRRIKELVRLVEGAAKRAFGNSLKEMFYIDVLCSHPDYQGHGYGSAVLDTVTAMADAQGRKTWLVSSNIINTGFYNSRGFSTVADVVLGADDPDWTEAPFIVKVMIREPHLLDDNFNEKV